jgi:alkylhydroperoxidase family enzyme
VSDSDLAAMRSAGFSDADIVAMTGLVAQFLMTNFMNNIAEVELDFPSDVTGANDIALASDRP